MLGHPCGVRFPGDAEDVYPPGCKLDGEQCVQGPEHERFDSEEVERQDPPEAWARRNSPQAGLPRRGAGPSPLARRSVRILVAETLTPSLASSLRILRLPHLGFSLPIRRMSSRTSSLIGGLPPTEVRRKLHFLRTSSQCQRRSVCGVQERQPPGSRKDPAHRGHEHTVATAKKRPPRLPPEDHQLVAKEPPFRPPY